MKQSIFSFGILIGCLGVLAACSPENTPDNLALRCAQENISVLYTFDDTCGQRIKSIESSDPNKLHVVTYYSDEELQAIQKAYNQSSNYNLTINEDEENSQFTIDLAINLGEGNNIHIVQSKEDFMNNTSVNVETIELQWLKELTLNTEGTVELVGQEVNGGSIKLIFNLTDNLQPNCTDTLTITNDIQPNYAATLTIIN